MDRLGRFALLLPLLEQVGMGDSERGSVSAECTRPEEHTVGLGNLGFEVAFVLGRTKAGGRSPSIRNFTVSTHRQNHGRMGAGGEISHGYSVVLRRETRNLHKILDH
jgi:hypothetical protein